MQLGAGRKGLAQSHEVDASGALAASATAAWRWEVGAPVVTWSAGAPAALGVPEIVLRSPDLLVEAVHPADLELVSRALRKSWATGGPLSGRFRLTIGGQVRWFEASGGVVHGADRAPLHVTGIAREVTETHEAEAAVIEALREAEEVLAQLGAGVGEWDATTNLVRIFTGPAGFGSALPGEVRLDVLLRDMDDLGRSRIRASLPRAIVEEEPFAVEVKVKASDGEIRRVMVKGASSPSSAGRVRLVALVLGRG